MKYVILIALAAIVSCGGGTDLAAVAQCNGTPQAAVVYVGGDVPAQLAAIPDACVYSTSEADLDATVLRAKVDTQQLRVYMIGNATAAPLDYMAAHPGSVSIASLWFAPAWSGDLGGSLVSIYANGGVCPVTSNHEGPVTCLPAQALDLQAAVTQLHL